MYNCIVIVVLFHNSRTNQQTNYVSTQPKNISPEMFNLKIWRLELIGTASLAYIENSANSQHSIWIRSKPSGYLIAVFSGCRGFVVWLLHAPRCSLDVVVDVIVVSILSASSFSSSPCPSFPSLFPLTIALLDINFAKLPWNPLR